MKSILFIDACVRKESRTRRLAEFLLSRLGVESERLCLSQLGLKGLDEYGTEHRDSALAKQFAAADIIVAAAPYWDLSFPSILKTYIEHICVNGVTFRYSPEGVPIGLCSAKKLYYVTTSGGPIMDDAFGFGYIQALAKGMFGIPECVCIKAENLDIAGNDVEAILERAEKEIKI